MPAALLVLAGFLVNLADGFRSTWSVAVGIFGLVAASSVIIFLVVKPSAQGPPPQPSGHIDRAAARL